MSRLLLNLKLGVPLESCVIFVPMFSILKRAFSILESPRRLSSIENARFSIENIGFLQKTLVFSGKPVFSILKHVFSILESRRGSPV